MTKGGNKMSEKNYSQIAYMPYAPIKEPFQIGNYEVWSYQKMKKEKIEREDIIKYLDSLFGMYYERLFDKEKGGFDKNIDEIYIIAPVDYDVGNGIYTGKEINDIRSISHIIAFSAISELHFISQSTDPFVLYLQNFNIDSEGVTIWSTYFTRFEMVKFMKPYNIESFLIKYSKTTLAEALGEALEYKNKNEIKRIFRSLEKYFYTATRGKMVTNENRLLSLLMCFVLLLDFEGKIEFVKKVEELLDFHDPIMETRYVSELEKDFTTNKTSWWVYDLYKLRNDIVHGNDIDWQIDKYGGIWQRIEFGGILLRKLIKKILLKNSLWEKTIKDKIIEADSIDKTLSKVIERAKEIES